ncbi:MAG: glycosyltransferase [Opitutaceae bacterium]
MKLSIVIPCYNESKTIRTIVDRVRAAPVADKEIIIVDYGSADQSAKIIRSQAARAPRFELVELSRNFGFQSVPRDNWD